MGDSLWSWSALFGSAAKKIVSNVIEVATSKTTWLTIGGIVMDVMTAGNGKPTKASLILIGGKVLAQAGSDWGKNAKK